MKKERTVRVKLKALSQEAIDNTWLDEDVERELIFVLDAPLWHLLWSCLPPHERWTWPQGRDKDRFSDLVMRRPVVFRKFDPSRDDHRVMRDIKKLAAALERARKGAK